MLFNFIFAEKFSWHWAKNMFGQDIIGGQDNWWSMELQLCSLNQYIVPFIAECLCLLHKELLKCSLVNGLKI